MRPLSGQGKFRTGKATRFQRRRATPDVPGKRRRYVLTLSFLLTSLSLSLFLSTFLYLLRAYTFQGNVLFPAYISRESITVLALFAKYSRSFSLVLSTFHRVRIVFAINDCTLIELNWIDFFFFRQNYRNLEKLWL